jgi:hypothetical protein
MKTFPMHFDLDKRLKETCEKMKDLIEQSGEHEWVKLVDPSQMSVLNGVLFVSCLVHEWNTNNIVIF